MPVGQRQRISLALQQLLFSRGSAPGGTYVQCESVSLSRAIPTGLGWLVGPFVTSIPRESLEFTLGSMRKRTALMQGPAGV